MEADVSTTMIYTHVLNGPGLLVKSEADLKFEHKIDMRL